MVNADASPVDELNPFFPHSEADYSAICASSVNSTTSSMHVESACENTFIILENDVRKAFRKMNTRKAAGSDGISGRVLRACADQLAPMFTEILNLSWAQCVIPMCFKQFNI